MLNENKFYGAVRNQGILSDGFTYAETSTPKVISDWSELLQIQNAPLDWSEQIVNKMESAVLEDPRSKEILPLIELAEAMFGMHAKICGTKVSMVHGGTDLKAQSYAMALNTRNHSRIVGYVLATLATHLLDDFLDPPDQVFNRQLFKTYRNDIKDFLDNWGSLGKLAHEIAEYSAWPEGYYHGLRKMFYGALITQSDPLMQRQYLSEYMDIVNEKLSPEMRNAIKDIRPLCYSLTNKSVCEIFPMDTSIGNYDAAEIRSLCYAPILLLVDLPAEAKNEELNYYGKAPSIDELSNMVYVAQRMLRSAPTDYVLFQEQFNFVIKAFDLMIPEKLKNAYRSFAESLSEICG